MKIESGQSRTSHPLLAVDANDFVRLGSVRVVPKSKNIVAAILGASHGLAKGLMQRNELLNSHFSRRNLGTFERSHTCEVAQPPVVARSMPRSQLPKGQAFANGKG